MHWTSSAAMDAFQGIADGMDQINHLQFVIRAMNPGGGVGPVDLQSERSQKLIALLKEKKIVVDPTLSWGEMAGHPGYEKHGPGGSNSGNSRSGVTLKTPKGDFGLSCVRGSSDCTRNQTDFRNYKKYGADTNITFGGAEDK